MKLRNLLIIGLVCIAFLCSCSSEHKSFLQTKIGKDCKVQFNRNALGRASTNPVPPNTDIINGADVSMNGKLKQVDKDAVIITSNGADYWIPKSSILSIRFTG